MIRRIDTNDMPELIRMAERLRVRDVSRFIQLPAFCVVEKGKITGVAQAMHRNHRTFVDVFYVEDAAKRPFLSAMLLRKCVGRVGEFYFEVAHDNPFLQTPFFQKKNISLYAKGWNQNLYRWRY